MAQIDKIIEGMQILQTYMGSDLYIGGAEHDIIYVWIDSEGAVSESDRERLVTLGFHYDDEYGWCIYT